jgi:putative heme-binding domain-containing protein
MIPKFPFQFQLLPQGRSALLLFTFHLLLFTSSSSAISVGGAEKDTSPEAELASFTVMEGFAVNLFASEKDGVVNPISIRWDEYGRLWVLTSPSYPQAEPGVESDDKILILEDTDGDGKSDKTIVFADKLRMPMGLELAPSVTWPAPPRSGGFQPPTKTSSSADAENKATAVGNRRSLDAGARPMAAYVGEGEKLWLMRDTDGDGKADVKEVVFSGFGTGDTHQSINSLTWTPDGALLFSQGLHCASNVSTAWGGRKLYGAGFWLYRPLSGKLTPYPTGFPLNAWGTVYDDHGQPFTVAGAAGMFWTTPLLISSEHRIEGRALPNNGQIVKEGMLKYCGVDIPRNAHWPAEMHGELVSGGFFENCIYRHKLQDDKANPSGYEAVRQPDLLKSSSIAFRPVDVKFGPEGALYISDWYNPIIGHYQASFRHPDRDKVHGRIWRVVKKGKEMVKPPALAKLDTRELIKLFGCSSDFSDAGDRWQLYQIQRLLMGHSLQEIEHAKGYFLGDASFYRANPLDTRFARALEVSGWMRDWFEVPMNVQDTTMLEYQGVGNHVSLAVRAAAVRRIGFREPDRTLALERLRSAIDDESPRVRLEAIAACSHIPKAESVGVALRALDWPSESFIDRALELTIHALAPYWEPALAAGQLTLPPKHLAYLLEMKSSPAALARVREMLSVSGDTGKQPLPLDAESRRTLLLLLAKQGEEQDFARIFSEAEQDEVLMQAFAEMALTQNRKPPESVLPIIERLLKQRAVNTKKCSLAVRLAGHWELRQFLPTITTIAKDKDADVSERKAALYALGRWKLEQPWLGAVAADKQEPAEVRLESLAALLISSPAQSAKLAAAMFSEAKDEAFMKQILAPMLSRPASTKALVKALTETPCSQEAADLATRALIGIGRNEPELTGVLNKILGRAATTQPFDAQWVSSLGNETTTSGNAKHGKEIFERPAINCIACHQIGGKGGIIGPQLDALGRGVPIELIVEAVMWPQRQIKEGYTATTVTTKDGRTLMGYKTSESDSELGLRDMAVGTVTTLPKSQLATRTDAGSLMPEGLTASLSREELRDLIAYLASLGK